MKNSAKALNINSRALFIFVVIMLCIGICGLRVALINIHPDKVVSSTKAARSITVAQSRGCIYDRNFKRLVGLTEEIVSVVKPTTNALATIRGFISAQDYVNAVDLLGKGNLLLIRPERQIISEDILNLKVYNRYYDFQLAPHLTGTVSEDGSDGLSGIEKGYDSFLKSNSGVLNVRFLTDGTGKFLRGGKLEVVDNNYNSSAGIVLTLDSEIQRFLEKIVDNNGFKKGAAVMLDVNSGAVVASVSRPNFNPNRISDYLKDENQPLFNRVLGAYPVGSVFKTLVAASALEQGVNPQKEYFCNGSINQGGVSFGCTKSHGKVNMASALVFSCNCYFVNLSKEIDINHLRDTAESVGFGNPIELADGIKSYSGTLPSITELESDAAKANFSFGQGSLTASPLQVAMLYCAVANSGKIYKPYLVSGFCDAEGSFELSLNEQAPVNVFSKETADLLSSFLELAVREGTGKNARTEYFDAAGKTATAQSGDFSSGKERLVTWFAGFFPYENPRYVLVVMNEDGKSGSADCAPIFSAVASFIAEYERLNK